MGLPATSQSSPSFTHRQRDFGNLAHVASLSAWNHVVTSVALGQLSSTGSRLPA